MIQTLFVAAMLMVSSFSFAQDDKANEFLKSAEWGELEEVKSFLSQGVDVNFKNEKGNHAGVYALYNFEEDGGEMIRYLMSQGLNPKILDNSEKNLMHLAAENKGAGILKELKAKGVDMEGKNEDGETPLFVAASNKDFEAVKILVELGANPNVINDEESIINYYDLEDDDQWNDLMAFPLSDELLVQLMLMAVYELESPDKLSQVLEKDVNWKEVNYPEGVSVLNLAAELDESEVLRMLLDKGFDPNQVDEEGKNALWNAETEENMLLLIKAGADVNQIIDGESLLSTYIYYGLSDFVSMLIENGADVFVKKDGASLVKYCKELLELGVRPGPQFENPEDQAADLKNWKADITKSMDMLKQKGVK